MALVVLGEEELAIDPAASRESSKRLFQLRLLKEPFLDPKWDRHSERLETVWRVREVGLQQALELDEGLFEEHDAIDAVEIDLGRVQTVADGMGWKARIVLLAGEAFLLSRRDEATILHEGSSTVMVKCRDTENTHGTPSRLAPSAH